MRKRLNKLQALEGQGCQGIGEEQASRERLHYLLSISPGVYHVCKPSGDYKTILISEKVKMQLGYDAREFIDGSEFWVDKVHPDDKPGLLAELLRLSEHEYLTHKYRFLHKDGKYRWLLNHLKLVRNDDGTPLEIDGFWVDITESKRKEDALEDAEKFTSSILNNASTPILVFNSDKSIRYVNPAFEKATGFSCGELIGRKPPYPWWSEETIQKISEDFEKTFYNGSQGMEELFKKKNGERFWVEITSTSIRRNDEVRSYLSIWVDITRRKTIEWELQKREKMWSDIMDNIGVGVVLISPAMEILSLNNQMKSWFPKIDETNKPICFLSFYRPPYAGICPHCQTIKTLNDGKVHETITATFTRDAIMNYRIISSPVKNKNGKVIAAIQMVENLTEHERLKLELKESEKKYQILYEFFRDAIILLTPEEGFIGCNPAALELFGINNEKEFTSPFFARLSPEYQPDGTLSSKKAQQMVAIAIKKGTHFFEWKHKRKDGIEFFSDVFLTKLELYGKRILQVTIRNINDQKLVEQALIERQRELETKSKYLEETNTALSVLLKKRDEDKKELEEKVLLNIKEKIEPYLLKLKKTDLNESQKVYLNALGSHLENIVSPFLHTLFSMNLYFTPAEIKVAEQIKEGKTNKEIALCLNLSPQTIGVRRKKLRKKLGITNKKINLRTYLQDLK